LTRAAKVRYAPLAARGALAVAGMLAMGALAVPLTSDELAGICAQAEDPPHCGRLVEATQLKRLPSLAVRDGVTLKVSLYPSGTVAFTDTEALNGGRSHSLWDYISEINSVVLYITDGEDVTFLMLQRATGRKTELPADPKISPDGARLVTADFCAERCVNELAIWRVTRDGVRKEASWKPPEAWTDAVATWKGAQTLTIEYTNAGAPTRSRVERNLADPSWTRIAAP
jgi:hypothetical protein